MINPQAGSSPIRAQILEPQQVAGLWWHIAPLLENVPGFNEYWTIEAVAEQVCQQQMQVWAFGEERIDVPQLIAITQVFVYPKRKVLEILWIMGKNVRRYEETATWFFDTFAEMTECDLVRFRGPIGIERLLKQCDWYVDGMMLQRPVGSLRRQ